MRETPLDVARNYTRGLIFPASKEEVAQTLERNGAPPEAVDLVRSESHPRYASANDLQVILRRVA